MNAAEKSLMEAWDITPKYYRRKVKGKPFSKEMYLLTQQYKINTLLKTNFLYKGCRTNLFYCKEKQELAAMFFTHESACHAASFLKTNYSISLFPLTISVRGCKLVFTYK